MPIDSDLRVVQFFTTCRDILLALARANQFTDRNVVPSHTQVNKMMLIFANVAFSVVWRFFSLSKRALKSDVDHC